jgi:hypothetical protein
MRLRALLRRGAVAGCAPAFLPAPAALAAMPDAGARSARAAAVRPAGLVVATPPSMVGGLPATSLDGSVRYVPRGSGPAAAGRGGGAARGARSAPGLGGAPLTGYDVSWPQCGGAMPPSSQISIVGVDDGHPFSQNPCLQQEAAWAATATQRAQYMVLDSPVGWSSANVLQYADHGPAGDCAATDYSCQSYNWGYNAANADVQYADAQGASSDEWWLDVELPTASSIDPSGSNCDAANFWVCDPKLNSLVIVSAVTALEQSGKHVGVYSTQGQWQAITGGLTLGLPIWIAGFDNPPATYCDPAGTAASWFALGSPQLVQGLPGAYDPDTGCQSPAG